MFQALRSRRPFLLALVFLLALSAAVPLAADDAPWEDGPFLADPAEMLRAATASPGEDGEDVVVLLSERRYAYDEQGRSTYTWRVVYRILSANADSDWSEVSEGWAPWHQERPQLKARVIAADGTVHLLDPATVAESATSQEPEMYEDDRVLRAPLPAIGPGAVVEVEVTGRDTAPFFDRGTVQLVPVRFGVRVLHRRTVVEAPASLPLRYVTRRLPEGGVREEVEGDRRRLTFEYRNLEPVKDFEVGMPAEDWLSYVAFSTGPSWSAVAQRYSEIVEETIRAAETDKAADNALRAFLRSTNATGKSTSTRETIDRILARLGAEVRYTGVELGAGSIVPRPPAETLRRKFGDCKDKAVLLAALLRRLDIPARVALLYAGEGAPEVDGSLPGLGVFNHAIVVVPGVPGEPAIWIDPTDRYARAGELPVPDQGRLALIADPATDALVRTPEATAAENSEVETREIYLVDMGHARVVETTELSGAAERDLRASYAAIQDDKKLRESLAGYVSSVYRTDKLGKVDHSNPADLSAPFRLRLEAEGSERGITDMQAGIAAVFPAAALGRLPDELRTEPDDKKPRKFAYEITRPFSSEIRYRIVPPVGFEPQPLPPARTRQLGPATLSEEYANADGGVVTATIRFSLDKRRLSAEEFAALRKAASAIWVEDGVLVRYSHVGETHLAAGRVREALVELERLAALSPDKALPRLRTVRALLAGGMGESAREEARRATELEPGFAMAWSDLGWTLVHDPVGRLFGEGFDRAEALAAYRKAKELDPKDADIRRNLAILLEHDEKGRRYSRHADLAAAIDEYKALKADLDDNSLDDNLVISLLWAERFAEARELLDSLDTTPSRLTLRLVALAATDGAPAAAQEAERRFSDREKRRDALDEAAGTLIRSRRYAEAAALLEQASRQGGKAAELLGRAELMRKARRHEDLTFPAGEPATVAKRLFLFLGSESPDPQGFLAFFSRGLREELGKEEGAIKGLEATLSTLSVQKEEIPPDVLLDLAMASLQETVTGDDNLGYRVILSIQLADEKMTFYIVREDGEYRIAGLNETLYSLGLESLLRVERGDLAGARQWLDWAREEAPAAGGDDPLASAPFSTLWTRGAKASAEEARCAAASLMARNDHSGKSLPILTSCRDAAPEGPRRTAFDLALVLAAMSSERHAEAAEGAQRLAAAYPKSGRAYRIQVAELAELKRWDDMRRVAEERLARFPDDAGVLIDLSGVAEQQGDLEASRRYLQRIVDSGKAEGPVFNNLAWQTLFQGKVDEQALALGQRAVTLEEYRSSSSLHTLASLYAEMGKAAEAYQIILQALEAGSRAPGSDDWYVFGRLAEDYGLPSAARRYYARVEPVRPGGPEAVSTYKLAQQRLAALGPESKTAKPGRQKTR